MPPERPVDYPAAHSMDTEWFAVDADGHVARFGSGEPGPVPDGACTENELTLEDLRAAVPEAATFSLRDWSGEDGTEQHIEIPEPPPPSKAPGRLARLLARDRATRPDRGEPDGLGSTLMFLDSLDRVRKEVDGWSVTYAPATEGVAVLFHNLPLETAWRLHGAGACLGCFLWPDQSAWPNLDHQLPDRLGLFTYEADYMEFAPYYNREGVPSRPLRLDDLPAPLRERIARLRLESLRFAEAPRIQPIAHTPCETWGDFAYLDIDGRTVRPLPGQEDQYRVYYERHAAREPRFHFEPPPNDSR